MDPTRVLAPAITSVRTPWASKGRCPPVAGLLYYSYGGPGYYLIAASIGKALAALPNTKF